MTPEEFYAILQAVPAREPPQHRLYHDDAGRPLFYTMEDLPGTWIEVSPIDYVLAKHDVKVKDGKIVDLPKTPVVRKLQPSTQGTSCHPKDICLIVDTDHPNQKWNLDIHE